VATVPIGMPPQLGLYIFFREQKVTTPPILRKREAWLFSLASVMYTGRKYHTDFEEKRRSPGECHVNKKKVITFARPFPSFAL
jgi:hypothetical protein